MTDASAPATTVDRWLSRIASGLLLVGIPYFGNALNDVDRRLTRVETVIQIKLDGIRWMEERGEVLERLRALERKVLQGETK